jgi:hypothetical protein
MSDIIINPYFFVAAASYDSDAQAMFDARAAVGDEPATPYKQAISDYVTDLKAVSGLWDDIIQLVVLAGATTVAGASLSIKGNNLNNTALVDADIDPKTGAVGDGTTKNWSTGYSGTVSGTGQNDFHTFAYFSSTGSGGSAMYGNGNAISGTWNQRKDGSRCRSSGSDAATSASSGMFGMNRSASGSYQRMHAGTVSTVTRTSQAPAVQAYILLGGATTTRQDARILVWAMGPSIASLEDYATPTTDLLAAIAAI